MYESCLGPDATCTWANDLDKTEAIKFINAAAGYLKKRAVADACIAPRADGSTPSKLSAAFRSSLRAKLQIALMKGNGMIATEVGL